MRKLWLLLLLAFGGAYGHAQAPPQANILTYCTASNGTVAICPSGTAGASTNLYPQGSVVTYCLSTQGALVPCPPGGSGTTSPGGSTGQLQFNNAGVFGGTSSLPKGTTYTSLTPASTTFFGIVSAGDSRFAGQSANIAPTQNFIAQLNTQPQFVGRTTFATNGAVAGSTCATMTSNYTSHVYPSRPAANGGVPVFQYIMIGINDIRASVTVNSFSSCYYTYLQTITADGFSPVIATIYFDNSYSPAGNSAQDLVRLQYNNYIRSLQGQIVNGQTIHVFDADAAIGVSTDLAYVTSLYNSPQANFTITGYSVASGVGSFTTSAAAPPAASTTATFTTSSSAITVANAAGIISGQYITGTGLPVGAYVTTVSGTTVNIAPAPTTAAETATPVTFGSAVLLSGFPATSSCLNASPNAVATYVSSSQFTMPVSCANVTSSTDTGLAQAMYFDGLHLNPQAVATVLAPAANRDFALYNSGTTATGTPTSRNDWINPVSGTLYVTGNIKATGTVSPTTLTGTTPLQSTTSAANGSFIKSTGGTAQLNISGSNNAELVEFATGSFWQIGTCRGTADLVICNGTSVLYPFDISTTAPTGSLAILGTGVVQSVGGFNGPTFIPSILYSAAGTALPTCAVGIKGSLAVVSDATAPLYMTAYTSGGAITTEVICSYNGTTYSWLTK